MLMVSTSITSSAANLFINPLWGWHDFLLVRGADCLWEDKYEEEDVEVNACVEYRVVIAVIFARVPLERVMGTEWLLYLYLDTPDKFSNKNFDEAKHYKYNKLKLKLSKNLY